MMKYEQDFIYQIIPNLTRSIEGLTKELKRYNDQQIKDKKDKEDVEKSVM